MESLRAGGGDDLAKPSHVFALTARLATLTRRRADGAQVAEPQVHELTLDPLWRRATRQGHRVALRTKELTLPEMPTRDARRIVMPTMLRERARNFDVNTSVVEAHVRRPRSQTGRPSDVPLFHAVRDAGHPMHGPGCRRLGRCVPGDAPGHAVYAVASRIAPVEQVLARRIVEMAAEVEPTGHVVPLFDADGAQPRPCSLAPPPRCARSSSPPSPRWNTS